MKIKFSFILFLIVFINLQGQSKYDFNQFTDEISPFLKTPGEWEASDFLILSGLAAASYGLMHVDEDVKQSADENNQYSEGVVAEFGRIWGEPYTFFGIGLLSIISGNSNGNQKNKKLGFEILQSTLYAVSVTQTLKMSFGRSRPYLNEGAFSFGPPVFLDDSRWSFPSGHTTMAFSLSTVLSANSNSDFMKVVYFIPAFLTAGSRVYQNKHWLSDVFMGAAIGYFVGRWVTNRHETAEFEAPTPPVPVVNFQYFF